ncbi:MAG: TerB family tellurite resistance protein [Gammaproteobacteria bacterium]
MLDAIKTFFEEHMALSGPEARQDEEHRLRVAVAALLTEMVRMDEEIAEAERAQVLASIAEKFELDVKDE